MSDGSFKFEKHNRSLMERLFEPPAVGQMSPVAKVVAYVILFIWSLFVLFPIYWVVITSFKDAQLVNEGPYYIPFVDFMPTLDGWHRQFVTDAGKVFLAFFNSIIISVAATALCMVIGSMAAYALARIEYKPKFGSHWTGPVLPAGTGLWQTLQKYVGQWRHSVLDHLAAYSATSCCCDPGLYDVPGRGHD
jgi:multiple sugar transport system permease protein